MVSVTVYGHSIQWEIETCEQGKTMSLSKKSSFLLGKEKKIHIYMLVSYAHTHIYTHKCRQHICLSHVVEGRICPINTFPPFWRWGLNLLSQSAVGLAVEPRLPPESQSSSCLSCPSAKITSRTHYIQHHYFFLTISVTT